MLLWNSLEGMLKQLLKFKRTGMQFLLFFFNVLALLTFFVYITAADVILIKQILAFKDPELKALSL